MDHLWEEFERLALRVQDLQDQMSAAKATSDFGLARTLAERIKAAETARDRLLCRIAHQRCRATNL